MGGVSTAHPAALQHGNPPPTAVLEGGPGPHPATARQSRRGLEMLPSGQHEHLAGTPSPVRNQSRLPSLNCPGPLSNETLCNSSGCSLALLRLLEPAERKESLERNVEIHSRHSPGPLPAHFRFQPEGGNLSVAAKSPPVTITTPTRQRASIADDHARLAKRQRPHDSAPRHEPVDVPSISGNSGRRPRPSMTPARPFARH